MNKVCFCFALLFFFALSGVKASDDKRPAGAVQGRVLDAGTGEELSGVRIEISGSQEVIWSEKDGGFVLPAIADSKEEITLCLSLVSFETRCITISHQDVAAGLSILLNER
jgi:hypothetical protein